MTITRPRHPCRPARVMRARSGLARLDTLVVRRGGAKVFGQDYGSAEAGGRYAYEADGRRGGVVETRYGPGGAAFSTARIDWEYDAVRWG